MTNEKAPKLKYEPVGMGFVPPPHPDFSRRHCWYDSQIIEEALRILDENPKLAIGEVTKDLLTKYKNSNDTNLDRVRRKIGAARKQQRNNQT